MENSEYKSLFLKYFDSDELKVKYMRNLKSEDKYDIIASFKDEELKEKYLTFFSSKKSSIIKKLQTDERKIYYLRKFSLILSSEEKAEIIGLLQDDLKTLECLKKINDTAKVNVICFGRNRTESFYDKAVSMISGKKEIAEILKNLCFSDNLTMRHINKIDNIKDLKQIVLRLNDINQVKYLEKFNDKTKIEIINEMSLPNIKFESFKYINNKSLIFPVIDNCESFPEYQNEYDYIIDLYSEKYKLNKEHLLYFVKNISLCVLRVIENENIIKIINSNEEEFKFIMELFNKKNLKQDSSSINNILNTLLQRSYRINSSETIILFPTMLNAINSSNKNILLEKLNMISKIVDINKEINLNNWTYEKFVEMLLEKNQSAIDCLHKISTKYITEERNLYVQNNFEHFLEKCCISKYDKRDLIKYMIVNYPLELILSYFPKVNFENEQELLKYYSTDEISLLKNKELLEKIIIYRKNPKNYEQIPQEIQSNMKIFNIIFEKNLSKNLTDFFKDVNIERKLYEFKEIDSENLINIMMNLDIEKIKKTLLNDEELKNKLLKIWNGYKIGGWGDNFHALLSNAGMIIEPEIIANFIQYFGLSYKSLEEKFEKGELANISLTALLDLASCYSSESKKYSMVFGDENFKYIASNPGRNSASMSKERRIDKAIKCLKIIRNRKFLTIPPFDKNYILKNGKKVNIVVGNVSNIINLTYGERTESCMRIGGAGSSLFDFCLENENGFHIRFSDPNTGEFISRVSGFRNGNTVFLNQLRNSENTNYTNRDVVDACKFAAQEIVRISKNSHLPIDNIVITPTYSMGSSGMPAKNLGIDDPQEGMKKFYTDVSENSIVLATGNPNNELLPFKLGVKEVPKYPVQRDKKRILYNRECVEYINHLKILDQVLSGKNIDNISIENTNNYNVCFAGEDWCVMADKDGNIDKYIMSNTNNKAQSIKEAEEALNYLKQNLEKEITLSSGMSLGM